VIVPAPPSVAPADTDTPPTLLSTVPLTNSVPALTSVWPL
jgi:hypothetical protein